MPIITELIAPSAVPTALTVLVCACCGRDARIIAPGLTPLTDIEAWISSSGWVRTGPDEPGADVLCDRCAPVLSTGAHP